jgi:cyanophycin synthetase
MNIYDDHPFKVIMDYAHNPAAIKAMVDLSERMEPKGKRIVVLAAPGDRRDEDVHEIAKLCAGKFDYYICRRDDGLRGRESDEIPLMLRETLLASGVPSEQIEMIPEEVVAVDTALNMAQRDDQVLIFVDAISRTWRQIQEFQSEGGGEKEEVHSTTPADVAAFGGFSDFGLEKNVELIRDERGVRIAASEESD